MEGTLFRKPVGDANRCELFTEWTLECRLEQVPCRNAKLTSVELDVYSTLRENEGVFRMIEKHE